MSDNKERTGWINALKGLAIIAVLVDHCQMKWILYSIYAVPVFFLVLGFNAYNSMERNGESGFGCRLAACSNFLIFYVLATLAYALDAGVILNFSEAYNRLVFFTSDGHFYFCALYFEILLVSGLLYKLVKCTGRGASGAITDALALAGFWGLALLLEHVVIMPNLHGGGKYLFGSSYLFLSFGGMLAAKHYASIKTRRLPLLLLCAAVLLTSPLYIKILWANPPKLATCFYAGAIFFFAALIPLKLTSLPARALKLLGRYSVHIFMYHLLIMDHLALNSKRLTFIVALLAPLPIGYVLDRLVVPGKRTRALSTIRGEVLRVCRPRSGSQGTRKMTG